ncbi:unnamed protein product [Prorocentrum cordatum]|uniref:Uncharacterized protein n=1 Tax=Prorocentrum cordatum TaxID=2364126 RepID=A0ABN9SUW0_9DINO|nr:unnamed protein product [Polarella glacialis]
MLLMQLPIQVVAVPAALAPQQGAAPVEPWSLGGGLAPAEDCNFCHFPHGEEKFAQMEAFSGRAKGRRPRKGAGPREGQPGQRLSLFDHLDLVGSWSGWQQPGGSSSSSSICSWSSQSELAEAPVRGAAWPDFSAEGRQRLEAILLSAQPRHYYD